MADQKPVDIGKIKDKLQEAAGSLDDAALDGVAGGQQAEAILTCIILCSGKEKEKQQ